MFELPKLDYKNNALLPVMSEQTLDLHHGKHHQTYITNLNNFIKDTELEKLSLEEIIKKTSDDENKSGIFNNASQHWNHNLFWKCMKPNGGGKIPSKLEAKINKDFGSLDNFKRQFDEEAAKVFGSGWCWLVLKNGRLKIVTTPNQDNPLMDNMGEPLLGLDVWEHAYYLNYMADRKKYIKNFWKVVNWKKVSRKYEDLI